MVIYLYPLYRLKEIPMLFDYRYFHQSLQFCTNNHTTVWANLMKAVFVLQSVRIKKQIHIEVKKMPSFGSKQTKIGNLKSKCRGVSVIQDWVFRLGCKSCIHAVPHFKCDQHNIAFSCQMLSCVLTKAGIRADQASRR